MWIKDSAPKASSHIFRDKKSVPGGFLSWIKARRYLESFLGRSFCSDAIWKPIWDQKYLAHIWTVLFKTVWLLASHWTFLNYIWKVVIINTSHRVATKIQCLGSTTYSVCHMIMSRKGYQCRPDQNLNWEGRYKAYFLFVWGENKVMLHRMALTFCSFRQGLKMLASLDSLRWDHFWKLRLGVCNYPATSTYSGCGVAWKKLVRKR